MSSLAESRGMQELDDLVRGAHKPSPADRDELNSIVAQLHGLELKTSTPVVQLLTVLNDSLAQAAASPSSRMLTADQESVLRAAGSFVDDMPPIERRASTQTAVRTINMLASALTTGQAAARLGVTTGRIRQRLNDGTLLATRVGTGHRLPAFQFTDDGEVPGWKHIAPTVPDTVQLVSLDRFMRTAHADLTVDGEVLSPIDWLTIGGDTSAVVELIETAFVVHAS